MKPFKPLLAVCALAVAAVGCATPAPPVPTDGGPIPQGETFRWTKLQPTDAPALVAKLRKEITSQSFGSSIEPDKRAALISNLKTALQDPAAESKLADLIAGWNSDAQKANASGTYPLPPSHAKLVTAGLDGAYRPRASTPTITPTPDAEPPVAETEVAAVSTPGGQIVPNVSPASIVKTGGDWPAGAPGAWPIVSGSLPNRLAKAIEASEAGTGNLSESAPCDNKNTGSRLAPTEEIPAFEGRIYTPENGTIASTGAVDGVTPGVITPFRGSLVTRLDPKGSGVRQFKVEAHLLSNIQDPVKTRDARIFDPSAEVLVDPGVVRGHVVVEPADGRAPVSYFPGSPNTEFKTLCYKQDLGQAKPARAYVEAWIPLTYPSDPEGLLAEPGFQVRFESVDNFSSGLVPGIFLSADQSSVQLQRDTIPLGYAGTVPGGSVALRADDGLVVNTDDDPTNDLESALSAEIQPLIEPAVEAIQGTFVGFPTLAHVWLDQVQLESASIDLDLAPIDGDDERRFSAQFRLDDLLLQGSFGADVAGVPSCAFRVHAHGAVGVSGTLNRTAADPTRLQFDSTLDVTNVGVDSEWVFNPVDPIFGTLGCWLMFEAGGDLVGDVLRNETAGRLADLPSEVRDSLTLDIGDIVEQDDPTPAGGGFTILNNGFGRSCEPRSCQGGDVLIDANGVAVSALLTASDGLGASVSRRFPAVVNPTLSSTLADRFMATSTPLGKSFRAAAYVHPAFLNQLLRALAEGAVAGRGALDASGSSGGTDVTVTPSVAPIVLTRGAAVWAGAQPALTLYFPELRVEASHTKLSVDVYVGVDFRVDAATRRLIPRVVVATDVDTLTCPLVLGNPDDPADDVFAMGLSYTICANKDWAAGEEQAIPGLGDVATFIANEVVAPAVSTSLGSIELPEVSGLSLANLGNVQVANVDGFLAVFMGVPRTGVNISSFGNGSSLTVIATQTGLPGSGPVAFDISVRDRNNPLYEFHPGSTSGLVTDATSNYAPSPDSPPGLRHYRARATVTATRGGTSFTDVADLDWYG